MNGRLMAQGLLELAVRLMLNEMSGCPPPPLLPAGLHAQQVCARGGSAAGGGVRAGVSCAGGLQEDGGAGGGLPRPHAVYLSICVCVHRLSVSLSVCLCIYLTVCLSVYPMVSVCLFMCLSAWLVRVTDKVES